MAGVHGLDPWLRTLGAELAAEPEPGDVPTALAPLAAFGIDVNAVLRATAIYQSAPEADWHPDDWRRSHPKFPPQYALVIYVYTMQDPNVYGPLGSALHAPDRDSGPGGVSPRVRAFLPLSKLLDVALVEAARVWGPYVGQVFRGVKYAFPEPTLALHDPVGYFPSGHQPGGPPARELNWFEFNSSSTRFDVMYREWFCGKSGPRTVFTIQSIEGVSIKRFSAFPDEDEVLFRPLARFRVTGSVKKLTPADLGPSPPASGGFPDDVMLQQLPSLQEGKPPEPEPEPAATDAPADLEEPDHEAAARARALPRWIPDEEAERCMLCKPSWKFRMLPRWRRQHCRCCGWVVCSACAPEDQTLELDRWVSSTAGHEIEHGNPTATQRVCNSCAVHAPAEVRVRLAAGEPELRAELQQLSIPELRARAAEGGCEQAGIEDTKLSNEPKVELISLIVARHQAVAAAAAAAAAAAETAAKQVSAAQQAWAQKLEEMAEHYRRMEVRDLLPEAKAAPSIDDAAIEAALAEEVPQPKMVQLLVEAVPAMLLAEAAAAAGNDSNLAQ
eukprot:COSAG02_NODE_4620_length_5156_cov_2.045284_1_plen_557_part_00